MENDLSMHYVCTHEEAYELIQDNTDFFVSNCGCRVSIGACARSRIDVCLMFHNGEEASGSNMRRIDMAEVMEILAEAKNRKLVARPFRNAERTMTDGICFCCDDCCGYFLDGDEICDKGQFIEITDMNSCVHCGACVHICFFGARKIVDGLLKVDRDKCYGCGLCVELCPAKSIELMQR